MIPKKKLVDRLGELMELERSLVPLLNRHMASSLPFSQVNEAKIKAILNQFQKCAITQEKHAQILKQMRQEIGAEKNDVF
ncbi:MAG: hypothetical protein HY592_01510 [Candidatus Omnitrophica bacterium]|nr:hypothetical protein [Candidatus Omnitrophota bacterium]